MVKALNITGLRFGKLTAIEVVGAARAGRLWSCRCDCGEQRVVAANTLTSGNTKSCGCDQYGHGGKTLHGHAIRRTPTYSSWRSMRQRCSDPKHHNFPKYGGAGITYDPRWDDFAIFLADMGERPAGTSIDRLDNALGYSKENCRWATAVVQTRNRGRAIEAEFRGEMLPLQEIADRTGLSYATIQNRFRRGAPFDAPAGSRRDDPGNRLLAS